MRLFIYKDGRQLGPFSLEEARARVLTGELSAGDWAWAEGATQWTALKSVPGFSTVPTTTAPAAESGFISPTAEEELWRGRPSQILNLKLYFFWAVVLLGVLFGLTIRRDAWPAFAALALIGLLQIVLRNLRLYACQYLVTTQRVRVTRGLLSRHIQEIELFRVKDLTVQQWFFQRLFGLGTITVLSGDAQNPRLQLQGIPGAVELRERLRHEVIVLRQRYNVRELDRM
jgi:membrane protein YdbS with pleckstrin-like domain